jgi:hypothetical protein
LVDAGSGAAGIAAAAQWAKESGKQQDLREFGPLSRVPTAYGREVQNCDEALGRVIVHGHGPAMDTVHVVAADTGTTFDGLPLYTLNYKVRMATQLPP